MSIKTHTHRFGSNDGQPIDDHCSQCGCPWERRFVEPSCFDCCREEAEYVAGAERAQAWAEDEAMGARRVDGCERCGSTDLCDFGSCIACAESGRREEREEAERLSDQGRDHEASRWATDPGAEATAVAMNLCPSCGGFGDHGYEEETGRELTCYACGGTGRRVVECREPTEAEIDAAMDAATIDAQRQIIEEQMERIDNLIRCVERSAVHSDALRLRNAAQSKRIAELEHLVEKREATVRAMDYLIDAATDRITQLEGSL